MLHRSSALTVVKLLGGALLVSVPATAAGETCQSRPVTIVGTGPPVMGIPGDDVIVSGTSTLIRAGAGNDVLCLTPGSDNVPPKCLDLDAGTGDDLIDTASGGNAFVHATLGSGRDRFIGGRSTDHVSATIVDDQVSTGMGHDSVELLVTEPTTGFSGRYDAGPGPEQETLTVQGESSDSTAATSNIRVELDEQIVVGGVVAADVTGFHHVNLHASERSCAATPTRTARTQPDAESASTARAAATASRLTLVSIHVPQDPTASRVTKRQSSQADEGTTGSKDRPEMAV